MRNGCQQSYMEFAKKMETVVNAAKQHDSPCDNSVFEDASKEMKTLHLRWVDHKLVSNCSNVEPQIQKIVQTMCSYCKYSSTDRSKHVCQLEQTLTNGTILSKPREEEEFQKWWNESRSIYSTVLNEPEQGFEATYNPVNAWCKHICGL